MDMKYETAYSHWLRFANSVYEFRKARLWLHCQAGHLKNRHLRLDICGGIR